MTVVARGASRRANVPATRFASSLDVHASTRSASRTPASARARRLAPLASRVVMSKRWLIAASRAGSRSSTVTSCSPWRACTIVVPTCPAPMTKIFTAARRVHRVGDATTPVTGTVGACAASPPLLSRSRSCSASPRARPRSASVARRYGSSRSSVGCRRRVHVTAAPGSPGLLYVVEQGGLIRVVKDGKILARAVSRSPLEGQGGRRAGPARARVRPRLRHEPAVRRRLHRSERRHAHRSLPLGRGEGAPGERPPAAVRQAALQQPQRRHGELRSGRPRLRRYG